MSIPTFKSSPAVAPGRVLLGHPQGDEVVLEGDRPARIDSVAEVPFTLDELAVPAAKRVRSHEQRESLPSWAEPLQNGEDEPHLGTNPRSRVLTSQDIDLLAQHEDLDVLGA